MSDRHYLHNFHQLKSFANAFIIAMFSNNSFYAELSVRWKVPFINVAWRPSRVINAMLKNVKIYKPNNIFVSFNRACTTFTLYLTRIHYQSTTRNAHLNTIQCFIKKKKNGYFELRSGWEKINTYWIGYNYLRTYIEEDDIVFSSNVISTAYAHAVDRSFFSELIRTERLSTRLIYSRLQLCVGIEFKYLLWKKSARVMIDSIMTE